LSKLANFNKLLKINNEQALRSNEINKKYSDSQFSQFSHKNENDLTNFGPIDGMIPDISCFELGNESYLNG
jgi:hypothetical protein